MPNSIFFSAEGRGCESKTQMATTDKNDSFLILGFKHGKKWVDKNGTKCNMGFGRITKNTPSVGDEEPNGKETTASVDVTPDFPNFVMVPDQNKVAGFESLVHLRFEVLGEEDEQDDGRDRFWPIHFCPSLFDQFWPIQFLASPFWAIVFWAHPILAKANFGQSVFGQSVFGQYVCFSGFTICAAQKKWGPRKSGAPKSGGPEGWVSRRVGAPKKWGPRSWGAEGWGPEGWGPNPEKVGPRRVGAQKGGAPKGGGPEGWRPKVGPRRVGGPKFCALFCPSPAPLSLFLSFSGRSSRGILVF